MPDIVLPYTQEELVAKICDEYCRFPRECDCEDELAEYCEACPIAQLLA